jgi:hypothetical protein
VPSTAAAATPSSIRQPGTNFQASPELLTISRIPIRNIGAASIFHFDWGASKFLSKQVFIGLVGYAYQQVTDDSGQNPILGGFQSRVLGIGPQVGYIFPVGNMQGYLDLKAYGEFDAANRPPGWNAWLTFQLSPAAPSSTVTPTQHLATK